MTLLTGCDLSTHSGVDAALWAMLRFNDRVQAALFSPDTAGGDLPAERHHPAIPFQRLLPGMAGADNRCVTWQLEVAGLVTDRSPWTVKRLAALPQESQITRHICIEGWSQIGQWSGVPLHVFLNRVGADLRARYVAFTCFDGYSTSIDMPSALHPQTILALDFEQAPLQPQWGAPLRLQDPDQARVQECQEPAGDRGDEQISRRISGRTRATIGLRECSGHPRISANPLLIRIHFREHVGRDLERLQTRRNPAIHAGLEQDLLDFVAGDAVGEGGPQMQLELRAAVQRH